MFEVLRDQTSGSGLQGKSTELGAVAPENACRDLMMQVINQIEARLPGRIRGLFVYRKGDAFALGGSCRSYYSKQVAQQTASEVLVYRKLINNIKVHPPK